MTVGGVTYQPERPSAADGDTVAVVMAPSLIFTDAEILPATSTARNSSAIEPLSIVVGTV